jgi:hypothetical protein
VVELFEPAETATGTLLPAERQFDLIRVLCRPMPLHHRHIPFAVAWTPKAGCTSLTKWFLFQTGKLEEALSYADWIHRYRGEVFEARRGYGAELFAIAATRSKPIFKLVRNPYDRTVSSFLHVLDISGKGQLRSGRPISDFIAAISTESRTGMAMSFRRYLEGLKVADFTEHKINRHIDPQYRQGEEHIVTRIIKLENFEGEIRALEREFALSPSPLEIITHSVHHRKKRSGPLTNLADEPLEPTSFFREEVPTYESFYNENTRGLVQELYCNDFAHYGYEA